MGCRAEGKGNKIYSIRGYLHVMRGKVKCENTCFGIFLRSGVGEMADHRQQLARLSIAPPFHGQVPLYPPALQTTIHHMFPPLTPLGHGQFAHAPFPGPQFLQFRNRRQPGVSVGGPPKAQPTRSSFARTPIPPHLVPPQLSVPPPVVMSADIHPTKTWRSWVLKRERPLPSPVSIPVTTVCGLVTPICWWTRGPRTPAEFAENEVRKISCRLLPSDTLSQSI